MSEPEPEAEESPRDPDLDNLQIVLQRLAISPRPSLAPSQSATSSAGSSDIYWFEFGWCTTDHPQFTQWVGDSTISTASDRRSEGSFNSAPPEVPAGSRQSWIKILYSVVGAEVSWGRETGRHSRWCRFISLQCNSGRKPISICWTAIQTSELTRGGARVIPAWSTATRCGSYTRRRRFLVGMSVKVGSTTYIKLEDFDPAWRQAVLLEVKRGGFKLAVRVHDWRWTGRWRREVERPDLFRSEGLQVFVSGRW